MRIVITSAYKIGDETGTAKVSETLIKYLSLDKQVLYFCLGERLEFRKIGKNLNILTVPAKRLGSYSVSLPSPKTIQKVNKVLAEFEPDIIHSQNVDANGIIAQMFAKKNKIPYLLTFHYLPNEGLAYAFPKINNVPIVRNLNNYISRLYINLFTKNTDLILALNQSVIASLKTIGSKNRIEIIRNGMDLKVLNSIKRKPLSDKIFFLYLGSYNNRKNQEYLVNMFKYLPISYELNCYGNLKTGKSYVKKLRDIIRKNKIKNVKLHDFITGTEKIKAFKNANYFISASTKEVQSLVLIEALAAGLPIVALRNETTDELVNSKNGLTLSQKTYELDFAQELISYVTKNQKIYRRTVNFCKKSTAKFRIEKTSKLLIGTYLQEIKKKSLN